MRRLLLTVALAPLILLVSACASGSAAATTKAAERPLPAGRQPSLIALMVCRPKAQREINEVLGVKATVSDRTWVDHKYSCRYGYPNGSFDLSVKELSSWSQTLALLSWLGFPTGRSPDTAQFRARVPSARLVVTWRFERTGRSCW